MCTGIMEINAAVSIEIYGLFRPKLQMFSRCVGLGDTVN